MRVHVHLNAEQIIARGLEGNGVTSWHEHTELVERPKTSAPTS